MCGSCGAIVFAPCRCHWTDFWIVLWYGDVCFPFCLRAELITMRLAHGLSRFIVFYRSSWTAYLSCYHRSHVYLISFSNVAACWWIWRTGLSEVRNCWALDHDLYKRYAFIVNPHQNLTNFKCTVCGFRRSCASTLPSRFLITIGTAQRWLSGFLRSSFFNVLIYECDECRNRSTSLQTLLSIIISFTRWSCNLYSTVYVFIRSRFDIPFITKFFQLTKYGEMVKFNQCIVFVSLATDVLLIGLMNLPNTFIYTQFQSVAFIIKVCSLYSISNVFLTFFQ